MGVLIGFINTTILFENLLSVIVTHSNDINILRTLAQVWHLQWTSLTVDGHSAHQAAADLEAPTVLLVLLLIVMHIICLHC